MRKEHKSLLIKILKRIGLVVAIVLLLLFLIPTLFPETLTNKVKAFANEKLNGELSFNETHLSFFSHFPSLTLTLDDFLLKGSAPFQNDTLIFARKVAFGINVKSIFFDDKINIDQIFVSEGNIKVLVNQNGQPNYNVYVSTSVEETTDTSSASLGLERIDFKKMNLSYDDQSTKIKILAKNINYVGKGDLTKSVFDLKTNAQIESFDFSMDNESYLKNKKVNAELITKINTNSLAFIFEQNNLKINKLPVEFKGKFNFLKNGYALDFVVKSENSQLVDFFTALPPAYVQWIEKTKITGKTDLFFELKGEYIASENKKPDVHFNMKIRDGFISHQNTPLPAENLFLNFDTKLPSLDIEQLAVKVDSIYFDIGKDYLNGNIILKGFSMPAIDARIRAQMDLAKLDQALGLQNMDLKGVLKSNIVANGVYDKLNNQFPITKGDFSLKNGYLKTNYYPNPIDRINLYVTTNNNTGTFKDLKIKIEPSSFQFEGKPFTMNATFENFEDIAYSIQAKGELDLEKLYQVFSVDGIDMTGYAKVDVSFKGKQSDATNGNYNQLHNQGKIELNNVKTFSNYFPLPFIINEGTFVFNQNDMTFSNFKATYGQSDFKMEGKMQNVINYYLSESELLKGNFSFQSNRIEVDEFMIKDSIPSKDENIEKPIISSEVIAIPPRFNLVLDAFAQKVVFDGINIDQLSGKLIMNQGKLILQNTNFQLIGTKVNMNASYANESNQLANFDFSINATDFDIKRAYAELPMFREMVSSAEFAEGIVSLNYKIGGKLDEKMGPIYPSLIGGGVLSVKEVKMKGYKLFNTVSKKTNNESLTNPDLSKVDIKSTVKNNLVKIERFKFKVAGFRTRIEGESSFDGKINMKMRLGLPPLGIIGIPIKITGNQDDPTIGIGKETEDLEETEYKEISQAIQNDSLVKNPIEHIPATVKDSLKN